MKPIPHEYTRRINRVMDYVRDHRAEPHTVEKLASVAAFSPFHFHRVFKGATGENLMEFIQRTRLESAATELVTRPHASVLEVALDNGFASAGAFARAFRARFGMTASQWRSKGSPRLGKPGEAESKQGELDRNVCEAGVVMNRHTPQEKGSPRPIPEEKPMQVVLKQFPDTRVAYIRVVGPYGSDGKIPSAWQQLMTWANANGLWDNNRTCLGISLDDPKVTPPAKCRYDAAIEIPAGFTPRGLNEATIPGGKYATIAIHGGPPEILKAYDHLFQVWLPESGFEPDNRPMFERYTGDFGDENGNFRCDVCLPVRPL